MTPPPRGELNRKINGLLGRPQCRPDCSVCADQGRLWQGPDFEADIAATIAVCRERGCTVFVGMDAVVIGDLPRSHPAKIADNNYPLAAALALAGMLEQVKPDAGGRR